MVYFSLGFIFFTEVWANITTQVEQLQEKVEKAQGEIYRLKARLENAQSEKDSVQEELERAQATVARQHSERERWVNEVSH